MEEGQGRRTLRLPAPFSSPARVRQAPDVRRGLSSPWHVAIVVVGPGGRLTPPSGTAGPVADPPERAGVRLGKEGRGQTRKKEGRVRLGKKRAGVRLGKWLFIRK